MKKLLTALTAISALAIVAPAGAQYSNQSNVNANGTVGLQNRIGQLETRLQTGLSSGEITRSEATPLRRQLRELTRLERRYSRNGLTQQERADLQQRIRTLRQQFRMADGGGNGRWNDDDVYNGQGGPYEQVQNCQSQGFIGGLINSVLGNGNNANCGIRVGERVPSNLYGVPNEYRNQFRDGNGVYYRSDGRQIYQIDARTNTVVRVYGINR